MQLHRKIDLIRNAEAELYVIGNGSPSFVAGFRDETGWDGGVFTDPSLKVFEAAQLERGVLKTFDPRALGKTIKAFARGSRQGRTQGDAFQQGGVLVIAPGNVVRWQHVSKRPGDNASAEAIASALTAGQAQP